MRRFSVLVSPVLVIAILVGVGWRMHSGAIKIEKGHSQEALVTSYAEVSSRVEVVNPIDIPKTVQAAKQILILKSNGVPQQPPKYNASSILKNLISFKNQLRTTKYSRIYLYYLNSTDTPSGNSSDGLEEANWLVVCTGLPVPKTQSSPSLFQTHPSLLRRTMHTVAWYFGVPAYPDVWSAWLYSAKTGQLMSNTSGATPTTSWHDYVLTT